MPVKVEVAVIKYYVVETEGDPHNADSTEKAIDRVTAMSAEEIEKKGEHLKEDTSIHFEKIVDRGKPQPAERAKE